MTAPSAVRRLRKTSCVCWLLLASAGGGASAQHEIPHLARQGTATQLIVNGTPFLILGGELGNSSASSLEYMQPIWPMLTALNVNTVLAPVYWELVEPREGDFDFTLVDGLIRDARRNSLRLVLLWFGSWKNSMSSYAPEWVKRDQARFPRAETSDGHGLDILSPFRQDNWRADARAFAALTRHLRDVDGRESTVIMVQVENEVGMIPEARDHSDAADSLFRAPVPSDLMRYLRGHRDSLAPELNASWSKQGFQTAGSWEEIFGEGLHTEFSIESIREPIGSPLALAYATLRDLTPWILEHQGRGTMAGLRPEVAFDGTANASPAAVALGDYTLTVSFQDPWVGEQQISEHGGLIIALAPDEFIVAGTGLTVTFAPRTPGGPVAGLLSVDEGRLESGRWVTRRRLNGDQTHQGRHVRLPSGEFGIQRVRLYRYR